MLSLMPFFAMLMVFHLAWGVPAAQRTGRQAKLDKLRREYRGIYWDTAADPNECTDEQFDILAEAVRVAVNEVTPLAANHKRRLESSAFNRFFIRPEEPGIDRKWIMNNYPEFEFLEIMGAMDSILMFPKIGKKDRNGEYGRRRQIKYKCKPWTSHPCVGKTAAKTSAPYIDPEEGWSTVFCPTFFEQYKHIKELGNGQRRSPSALPLLNAYEHVIIHEWMHANIASGRYNSSHITDVQGNLPGERGPVAIYGATRSHQFAWVKARNVYPTSVNPRVAVNADNYAWYFTNEWFAQRWNWKDDGRNLALDAGEIEDLDQIRLQ